MKKQTLLKSTLCLLMAMLCNVAWAQTNAAPFRLGASTTTLVNGNYVLVAMSDKGTGPCFYTTTPSDRKYQYDTNCSLEEGDVVLSKYVWTVGVTTDENGVQHITVTNYDDNTKFFPADGTRGNNFNGTEKASLKCEVRTITEVDYIVLSSNIVVDDADKDGYIHANKAQGVLPNLSYWDGISDGGSGVKFTFYPVEQLTEEDAVTLTLAYYLEGSKVGEATAEEYPGVEYAIPAFSPFTNIASCKVGDGEATTGATITVPETATTVTVELADAFPYTKTVLTEDGQFPENTTWYVLKRNSTSGDTQTLKSDADGNLSVEKTETYSDNHLWCFVGNSLDLKIYNKVAGSTKSLSSGTDPASMKPVAEAVGWIVQRSNEEKSFAGKNPFCLERKNSNGWYLNNNNYGYWNSKDGGSTLRAVPMSEVIESAQATKTAALNELALIEEADYFCYSASAIAAARTAIKNAPLANFEDVKALPQVISEAKAALVATETITGAPAVGDYIQIKHRVDKKYLTGNASNANNTTNKGLATTVWYVDAGDNGNVKLKNVSTGKYIGQIRQSAKVGMVEEGSAANLSWTKQADFYAVFKDVSGGIYAFGHVNGGDLVGWERGAENTQWIVSKVDFDAPILTNQVQLSNDKVYTLRSQRAQLYYNAEDKISSSNSIAYDRNDPKQQFKIEKLDNGSYCLFSVGAQKYLKGDGTYTTDITEAAVLEMNDVSATYTDYPWKPKLGSNYFNSQTGGGLLINDYSATDTGNSYKIEVGNVYLLHVLGEGVEGTTVTINGKAYKNGNVVDKGSEELQKSDITPSVIEGKTTVINIDGDNIYVSYIDESTPFYTIKNGGASGYVSLAEGYHDENGNLILTNSARIRDKQGLWFFVPQTDGGYKIYNYSTGWSKVLGMTGNNENARAKMVAEGTGGYTTTFDGNIKFDGTDGRIKLKGSDNNYWNKRGNYLALWNSADAAGDDNGSKFFMNAVVDINEFVDVAKPVVPETREELAAEKITGVKSFEPENPNTLWYRTSAMGRGVSDPWMEYALPLGNGELGCMVYGGVLKEEIQFNEKTLWSGPADVVGTASGKRTFVNFGSLFIKNLDESINENGVTDYVRYLDIEEGVAGVKYTTTADNTKHSRKYFSSAVDQVIAGQYKIEEGEGKLNLRFTLEAESSIDPNNVVYEKDGMASFTGYMEAVNYAARVHVKVSGEGATITTTEEGIVVANATEVTFFLKGATNFDGRVNADSYFTNESPSDVNARVKTAIEEAIEKDFATIETAHRDDFKQITGRMTFSLDLTTPTKDTEELVDYYYPNNTNADSKDNDHLFLEQLYFHYGRYLAISSNRQAIAAPNNLQGIWSHLGTSTPWWNSDIHTNINVQMNYWPTEITNLSDLHMPFLNFIIRGAQSAGWKEVANRYNEGYGWSTLTETSLYNSMSTWGDNYLVANVWYTSHLWQHYRYTLDEEFLEQAFPAMWSAAEFWFHRLIDDKGYDSATQNSGYRGTPYSFKPDGTYVAPNEYSAEQNAHKIEDGTAHAQQMISYLFENISEAIKILGRDKVKLTDEQIATLEDHLAKTDKGLHTEVYTANSALNSAWTNPRNGVYKGDIILREWKYSPYDVSDDPSHRHMSHLMALFPLEQITPESPYFEPAVNSLKLRGDVATGWSMGWKTNLWARAQDGDHAHIIIKNALKHSTSYGGNEHAGGVYYNLFDSHAPFQIDGNFGVCSGMAEMLMQSAHGYINILPALPTVWERKGTVTGMKAMGNFTVDFNWTDGKVQQVTIVSHKGAPLKVRCNRGAMDIKKAKITVAGVEVNVTDVENGIATIPCNEGETVEIDFTTTKTVAYTVSRDTGTFNNSTSNWVNTWTFTKSKAQPAALQFIASANNIDKRTDIEIAPGQSESSIYTLKVPFPFLIKGYSFHCDGPDNGNQKIVIGDTEYPVKDGADIEVTGLSAQQAQFTLSGNNSTVELTSFKVYITTDPSFEYADSYENITKWYTMTINPNDGSHFKLISYTSDNNGGYPSCSTTTVTATAEGSTKAYAWAFVGDLYNGFKLYNRAAGGDLALYSSGSGATTMSAEGTIFQLAVSQQTGDGLFCLKTPKGNYLNLSGNRLGHYDQNDGGSTIRLNAFAEPDLVSAKEDALAEMKSKLNTLGNTVGTYAYNVGGKRLYTLDALRVALRDADTEAEINTLLLGSYRLNMPLAGEYFRIKSVSGWNNDAPYLGAENSTAKTVRAAFVANEDESTIFYYDGTQLVSYKTGFYPTSNTDGNGKFLGYNGVQPSGTSIGFREAEKGTAYAYNISFNNGDRWLYTNKSNYTDAGGSTNDDDGYCFILEPVTNLPVNISSVGYATLYAPVALKIPAGVKAYTGKINEGKAELALIRVSGVIPAKTGVVLYRDPDGVAASSEATTHNFEITTGGTDVINNKLTGYVATTAKGENDYTLQTHTFNAGKEDEYKGIAFKKYTGANITGGKAYLALDANANVNALRIRFADEEDNEDEDLEEEGTTGVEMTTDNSLQSTVIFDLQGRRVMNPGKGMYIVNGKKVIF